MTNDNKKILQVVADGSPGGGTTHVLQILSGLSNSFDMGLITQPNSYLNKQAGSWTNEVTGIDFFGIQNFPANVLALRRSVSEFRPDIIHAHGSRAGFITAMSRPKTPFIYTCHGLHMLHRSAIGKIPGIAAERYTNNRSIKTIFVSKSDLKSARSNYLIDTSDLVRVIYNGVEIPPESKVSKSLTMHIGFIGRLERPKDPLLFIEIVEKLPGFGATMIGGGSLEHQIKTEISERKLEQVRMLGSLDHEETMNVLSNFKVLLITSEWEAFGLVAVEAMARGVPVVAVQVGGLKEIIEDGESGLLIGNRSPAEIANAIMKINDNLDLREKIIRGGRKRVAEKFSVNRMIYDLDSVYNSLRIGDQRTDY